MYTVVAGLCALHFNIYIQGLGGQETTQGNMYADGTTTKSCRFLTTIVLSGVIN